MGTRLNHEYLWRRLARSLRTHKRRSNLNTTLSRTPNVIQSNSMCSKIDPSLRMYEVLTEGSYNVLPQQNIPPSITIPPYALPDDPEDWWKHNFANLIPLRHKPKRGIDIKDDVNLERMRNAGKIGRIVLNCAKAMCQPFVTPEKLDLIVHMTCLENGAYPSPLKYKGFPKSVCTSVNNVVVHGIPDDRPLENGDIINVDVSVFIDGVHGDLSETMMVGKVDSAGRKLVQATKDCLDEAIKVCGPGQRFNQIGKTVTRVAADHGFKVCPMFTGHGIGKCFHEPPQILHTDNNRAGVMKPGMTFTIEPVLVEGSPEVEFWGDGWTCVTRDGGRAAQFEHTLLITEEGVDILTEDHESLHPTDMDIRIYWNYVTPGCVRIF